MMGEVHRHAIAYGEIKSDDHTGLSLLLATPRTLGDRGDGSNPGQLFDMGYEG